MVNRKRNKSQILNLSFTVFIEILNPFLKKIKLKEPKEKRNL